MTKPSVSPTSFASGTRSPVRPDIALRTEAALVLIISVFIYARWYPGHWLAFALLLLAPDLALLAYLGSFRKHAHVLYNTLHSYTLPLLIGLFAMLQSTDTLQRLALIWIAHIAIDRALGFGLKYPGSFNVTHIQRSAKSID